MEAELAELSADASRLRYRNTLLEQRLNSLSPPAKLVPKLIDPLEEMATKLQEANARIASLENSTSWRITAPFRALARLFRGGR